MNLKKWDDIYAQDITYLFYTEDIEIEEPNIILGASEEATPVLVYPNPFSDFLFVNWSGNTGIANVLDAQGKTVAKTSTRQEKIDLSRAEPGVYFIQLKLKNRPLKTFRVIKKSQNY